MSRGTALIIPLALAACTADEGGGLPSPARPVVGADVAVSWVVDENVGPAPLVTWARALNVYGAAVAADPITLWVDGTPVTVAFDGTGYGQVRVDQPGPAEIIGGEAPVTVFASASAWPGFGANEGFPALGAGEVSGMVGVTNGAVVAREAELSWVGPNGRGHRVLLADGPILGLRAAHVDVDDILDVVAWSGTTVFVLRGRPNNGGLAWAAGFEAPGYTAAGVDAGDLDGDSLADLAIAWATPSGPSQLDVWNGDGIFGFTAAQPRNLPNVPMDLAIGDNTGEGEAQVTVLDESGVWTRYIAGSDVEYMPIGPRTPLQISIAPGSTLEASGDLNADRADELWIFGPLTPGVERSIHLVDLQGDRIQFVPTSAPAAHVTRADGDGNEVVDLFALHEDDRSLHGLSYDLTTLTYTPRRLDTLPEHAPIALRDWLDRDGIPDLFLAGADVWRWYRGHNDPNDPELFWSIREPETGWVTTGAGPIAVADLDGQATTTELVTFEIRGSETWLVTWQLVPGKDPIHGGEVRIATVGVAPLDVEVCAEYAWVALPDEVKKVDVRNVHAPSGVLSKAITASRIACGAGPEGALGAALVDGAALLLAGNLVELGSVPVPGARDLALGDVGLGPELRTCAVDGCEIAAWAYGAAGEGAFVEGADGAILVDGAARTLPGSGSLSVFDVDGDGLQDLLAASSAGDVTLVRSSGTGPAAPEIHHVVGGLVGAVGAGDVDGDGWSDLVFADASGDVRHTVAPWVPPAEDEPGDGSSDTGAPDTDTTP